MHKSEGGGGEVGRVATTCDAGAAGWSARLSPAANQRNHQLLVCQYGCLCMSVVDSESRVRLYWPHKL